MDPKRELESKAKGLIDTDPDKAAELYSELFSSFPDSVNEWDAYFAIKALRNSATVDVGLAHDLAERFNTEKVGAIYGWLIFDKFVKSRKCSDIIANEKYISELPLLSPQRNLQENDEIPCPSTISVLKLCDAHAENLFNALKIDELLSLLDYSIMSKKSKTIDTAQHGKIKLESDFEKYFALKTKALFKLERYDECIASCKIALEELKEFHFSNDLWFNMRIALCERGLGNHELSKSLLNKLLLTRDGNDKWFLYRDLAEIYFEGGDYQKAWEYAINASFFGNDPQYMIGLYLLQSRILFRLNRSEEGRLLAEFIAVILKDQNWKEKPEYEKLFSFYKIDKNNLRPFAKIYSEVNAFCQSERYKGKQKVRGKVVSVRKDGKAGRIKCEDGTLADFSRKDLAKKLKSVEGLINSVVEFYLMNSYEGKNIAENIAVVQENPSFDRNLLDGVICDGIVKSIADYGVFVAIDGSKDGLIHKSNLPENLRSCFMGKFKKGDIIKVVVIKITEKGLQLKLPEDNHFHE